MERLQIDTPRLVIRNLRLSDLAPFHEYRSNPEVTKYQGFDVLSVDEARTFIESQQEKLFGKAGEWVQYGIEYAASKVLIGDCAIRLDAHDARLAEIGITISHLHQKKGYAREALSSIMKFLFDQKGVHRITEIVDAENEASIALLRSTGFRLEGHFIENIFFKGKWGSEYQFALLKREWESLKTAK